MPVKTRAQTKAEAARDKADREEGTRLKTSEDTPSKQDAPANIGNEQSDTAKARRSSTSHGEGKPIPRRTSTTTSPGTVHDRTAGHQAQSTTNSFTAESETPPSSSSGSDESQSENEIEPTESHRENLPVQLDALPAAGRQYSRSGDDQSTIEDVRLRTKLSKLQQAEKSTLFDGSEGIHKKQKNKTSSVGDTFSDDDDDAVRDGSGDDSCVPSSGSPSRDFGVKFYFWSIVAFFVAIVLIICLLVTNPSHQKNIIRDTANGETGDILMSRLERSMATIRGEFTDQSPRFWSVIEASLRSVVNGIASGQPRQPSIIMIAGDSGTTDKASTVAWQVANSLQSVDTKAVKINSSHYENSDPDTVKLQLDGVLDKALSGDSKAAAIFNIENLSPDTLPILFKYCDHENAAYKDGVIVFTVCVRVGFDVDLSLQEKEEVVERFLTEHWKAASSGNLTEDFLSPLMSRIGNSVAIVT